MGLDMVAQFAGSQENNDNKAQLMANVFRFANAATPAPLVECMATQSRRGTMAVLRKERRASAVLTTGNLSVKGQGTNLIYCLVWHFGEHQMSFK